MTALSQLFRRVSETWEKEAVDNVSIIGTLRNPPSPGLDGYVSLDLELEQVTAGGKTFVLDGQHEVKHLRYIRVEYVHKDDTRHKGWIAGQRFKVDGPAKRDTDRWEFSEVNTTEPSQIVPIPARH